MVIRALIAALAVSACQTAAQAQVILPEPEAPVEIPPVPEELPTPEALDLDAEAQSLDALFAALATAGDKEWQPLQQQIMAHWSRSRSPSMTLLLGRATRAMEAEDYEEALQFLNDLVRLEPGFSEAWNRRATVHFLRKDYGRSVADIQRTLALEPRHFGALAGLGFILDRLDRDEDAYRVFQRALEIHPHLEGAREAVERLAPDVEGRPL
ncbi:MAG: hypothetical protein AAGC57_16680 [Pseudomonadota bacterium]